MIRPVETHLPLSGKSIISMSASSTQGSERVNRSHVEL